MKIDEIIDELIRVEGGYVNNKNDSGGETKYGITVAVARKHGYLGKMIDLPMAFARQIYMQDYVYAPKFDVINSMCPEVGAELVDTGVNSSVEVAAEMLQVSLNAFNMRGEFYPDLDVDGKLGQKTFDALSAYLKGRKSMDGVNVLVKALNCLQGARYLTLTKNPKNEDFVFGWIRNRVEI